MSMSDEEKGLLVAEHDFLNMENIKHFDNIIGSFMELFGDDEYIKFHNTYMLPLMKRTYLKKKMDD